MGGIYDTFLPSVLLARTPSLMLPVSITSQPILHIHVLSSGTYPLCGLLDEAQTIQGQLDRFRVKDGIHTEDFPLEMDGGRGSLDGCHFGFYVWFGRLKVCACILPSVCVRCLARLDRREGSLACLRVCRDV